MTPAAGTQAEMPAVELDVAALRAWPLPLAEHADKHARGTALVIGGSPRTVGAVILAGIAALRMGAGRLQIAVAEPAATAVAVAVPEALVEGLPVHADGRLRPRRAVERLTPLAAVADAVLIGPGLRTDPATTDFVDALVTHVPPATIVVLDAAAADRELIARVAPRLRGRSIVVANPGEVAELLGIPRERRDAADPAQLAARHGVVVVSNGCVAGPDGRRWQCHLGGPGLGTSGSGDVLAGLAVGAAARCGDSAHAACWATWAHAASGRRLATTNGETGFIAREIADGVPPVVAAVARAGGPGG